MNISGFMRKLSFMRSLINIYAIYPVEISMVRISIILSRLIVKLFVLVRLAVGRNPRYRKIQLRFFSRYLNPYVNKPSASVILFLRPGLCAKKLWQISPFQKLFDFVPMEASIRHV